MSEVGLSARLLWLISACSFRVLGAEVWQTDRHRSDKRQCSGKDPRRIIAWGYSYIILVTMWCMLKNISSYTSKSATNCATYCNRLTVWLRCDNLSISLPSENGTAYENRAYFNGWISCLWWNDMTRNDTYCQCHWILKISSLFSSAKQENKCNKLK